MSETVSDVLARILEKSRLLQLRGVPEPDTADEDEADDVSGGTDTAPPE